VPCGGMRGGILVLSELSARRSTLGAGSSGLGQLRRDQAAFQAACTFTTVNDPNFAGCMGRCLVWWERPGASFRV